MNEIATWNQIITTLVIMKACCHALKRLPDIHICVFALRMNCEATVKHLESSEDLQKPTDEESCEEEMDTSEAKWRWFYLAECGVWHMFEVCTTFYITAV